jgi:hypothetical protein
MRKAIVLALLMCLSACYESPSDLLAANANTIVRLEPVFSLSSRSYYVRGSGKIVELCELRFRSDLSAPCHSIGTMSVERTNRGNYIVQFLDTQAQRPLYKYGLWFRTDQSLSGKTGYQCFVWLGDGIVGTTDMSEVWLRFNGTQVFSTLSSSVRRVATETPINRQQLLQIASIYENVLSPLGSDDVHCIGERTSLEPKSVEIVGDNRHLQEYVPGPMPSL